MSAIFIQPVKHILNTSGGQRHAGIRSAIIEVERISIGTDGITAREYYIAYITGKLVRFLRAKDPFVAAQQAARWVFQVKEGQAQTINCSRRGIAYTMINDQPAAIRFDRGR